MPFIFSKVNIPVGREKERELKSRLGNAIELVPGKRFHQRFFKNGRFFCQIGRMGRKASFSCMWEPLVV